MFAKISTSSYEIGYPTALKYQKTDILPFYCSTWLSADMVITWQQFWHVTVPTCQPSSSSHPPLLFLVLFSPSITQTSSPWCLYPHLLLLLSPPPLCRCHLPLLPPCLPLHFPTPGSASGVENQARGNGGRGQPPARGPSSRARPLTLCAAVSDLIGLVCDRS